MFRQLNTLMTRLKAGAQRLIEGPQILAVLPAFVLVGYWVGGEIVLTVTAIGFPAIIAVYALTRPLSRQKPVTYEKADGTGKIHFYQCVDGALKDARKQRRKTACLVIGPDSFEALSGQHGPQVMDALMQRVAGRFGDVMRGRDTLVRLDAGRLGVVIAPAEHLSQDNVLQLAMRLQAAAERPLQSADNTLYLSVSVGFVMGADFHEGDGTRMAQAAEQALEYAACTGPSSIRIYAPEMRDMKLRSAALSDALDQALEKGQITPWFQPQISTDTGQITGFEALVRWDHPDRGIVTPGDFLDDFQKAGKMERLGEVVLAGALDAVKHWDALGIPVPQVGVNFSPEELRNPHLIKKIEWELDRHNLTPDRLAIEVLETVVAMSPDDLIVQNIGALSELGCQIDLDDFGTGHASISSLRRLKVQRLKIDRSFVTRVDRDPDQQRMVSAILLMAERLDLDILAEGIETAGEHAMLAQLGCRHVQGYGIGKPMPLEETPTWVAGHLSKLSSPPAFGFKAG